MLTKIAELEPLFQFALLDDALEPLEFGGERDTLLKRFARIALVILQRIFGFLRNGRKTQ